MSVMNCEKFRYLRKVATLKGMGFVGMNSNSERRCKKFNGEAALLFRACFHIEGDWRPFEDGILWENEGAASPVETKINIIPFNVLCNNTY